MSWYAGNTPSVIHDKPLPHGATRMGLLAQRQGYGAGTYGGLFADQIIVTNLNDTGAGSLRAAAASGPAWITFQPGMTAPARSTWTVPENNAPLGAYTATNIHSGSQLPVTTVDVTIDGRGVEYGIEGSGFTVNHGNFILHNFAVDFSQWWSGGSELVSTHSGLHYHISDPDASYSCGVQPIQKTVHDTIYMGVYSSTRTYHAGDVVTFNGVGYCALTSSNTNRQPDTHPTNWAAETPSTTGGAVGGTNFGLFRGTWSSSSTYQLGDGVVFSGAVYVSQIDSSVNQNPVSSGKWSLFDPNTNWKSTTTYAKGDYALFSPTGQNVNTFLYISTINSNLNNTPSVSGWVQCGQSGPVNGHVYTDVASTLEMGFWFDHNTFLGPRNGAGTPAKGATYWDFCDGGYSLCAQNHHVTYSWNYFSDCNKSIIIGCGSSTATDAGDWVTIHHCWFQRGMQRQPLMRFAHVHLFANYYDQDWAAETPAAPGGGVEMIAAESSVEGLMEGNFGYASVTLAHPLPYDRSSNANVVGTANGNVVTGSMTLASDQGSISFSPPYSYSLPALATTPNQNAFKTLMLGAGQQ